MTRSCLRSSLRAIWLVSQFRYLRQLTSAQHRKSHANNVTHGKTKMCPLKSSLTSSQTDIPPPTQPETKIVQFDHPTIQSQEPSQRSAYLMRIPHTRRLHDRSELSLGKRSKGFPPRHTFIPSLPPGGSPKSPHLCRAISSQQYPCFSLRAPPETKQVATYCSPSALRYDHHQPIHSHSPSPPSKGFIR